MILDNILRPASIIISPPVGNHWHISVCGCYKYVSKIKLHLEWKKELSLRCLCHDSPIELCLLWRLMHVHMSTYTRAGMHTHTRVGRPRKRKQHDLGQDGASLSAGYKTLFPPMIWLCKICERVFLLVYVVPHKMTPLGFGPEQKWTCFWSSFRILQC